MVKNQIVNGEKHPLSLLHGLLFPISRAGLQDRTPSVEPFSIRLRVINLPSFSHPTAED